MHEITKHARVKFCVETSKGCWENCKKMLRATFLCCTLYSSWRPMG